MIFLSQLNWVDWLTLFLIIASSVISFSRGLVREFISLLAWGMGIWAAFRFSSDYSDLFQSWIHSPALRYFVVFSLIFLLFVIIGIILGTGIHRVIRTVGLSLGDRIFGLVFGFIRGVVLASLVLVMIIHLGSQHALEAMAHAKIVVYFKPALVWLSQLLPDQLKSLSSLVWNNGLSFH